MYKIFFNKDAENYLNDYRLYRWNSNMFIFPIIWIHKIISIRGIEFYRQTE